MLLAVLVLASAGRRGDDIHNRVRSVACRACLLDMLRRFHALNCCEAITLRYTERKSSQDLQDKTLA